MLNVPMNAKDFGIVVVVAEEGGKQLEFFLSNFRNCYENVPICIISDGIDDPIYRKLSQQYKARYTLGRYLKRIECGGGWWKRTLEVGLSMNRKWILKVDPDTRFWRKFKTAPGFPISGSFNNVGTVHEHIQGGCQAISKEAAEKILKSGILESDGLTYQNNFCPDPNHLTTWMPTGYFTTDFSLMYIMKKLDIQHGNWPEVGCRWKVAPPNFNNEVAVTHPHKISDPKLVGVDDKTPLTVIITCKGRLSHLKKSLPRLKKEPNLNIVVVDYDCPEKCGNWVEDNFSNVRVARVHNTPYFNLARARNVGAKYAKPGWWCFMDADMLIEPGWAEQVRKVLAPSTYYVAKPLRWGMCGTVVVHSDDYKKAGGYDELLADWGYEDLDFYTKLRQVNVRPGFWNGAYTKMIAHSDDERVTFYARGKKDSLRENSIYAKAKYKFMLDNWRLPNAQERIQIFNASAPKKNQVNDYPDSPYYPPNTTCTMMPQKATGTKKPDKKPNIKSGPNAGVPFTATGMPIGNPFGAVGNPNALPNGFVLPLGGLPHGGSPSFGREIMHNISVVNHARLDLGMSLEELCRLGMSYLNLLAEFWPGTMANLIPTKVILPNTHALIIMDDVEHNLSNLGYKNTTPDGFPLAKCFVKPEMTSGVPVTVTFTHELGEFRVDPTENRSAVNRDGVVYAMEVADPVDNDSFILNGQAVANFVFPSWFEEFHKSGTVKFDYMGLVARPFMLSRGGYATIRATSGQWEEIYSDQNKLEEMKRLEMREWRNDDRKTMHHASTLHAHSHYTKADKR